MINNRFRYGWKCWLAAVTLFSAASCSPEKNTGDSEGHFSISGASGSAGTSSVVDIDDGVNYPVPGAGSGGQEGTPPREISIDEVLCEGVTSEGENVEVEVPVEVHVPQPVALYIMLDASWSMVEQNKWQYAFDAIQTFVNAPESNWISATIQIFPAPASVVTVDCSGGFFDIPAVPMGALPGNAGAVTNFLSSAAPIGIGTPIEAALNGAVNYCSAYKQDTAANPDGLNCVVVFVSDGAPNGCSEDFNLIASIAGTAYANNGVRTFAIGMQGADFDLLNMIGQKGEGDCTPSDSNTWACDVTAGSNFLAALELIRDTVIRMDTKIEIQTHIVDCEWTIPEPPQGQTFDRDMVNFQFTTAGANGETRLIPRADSADLCASAPEGWHYDDMENPTRIIACPQTCDVVRASENARIDILLGCETVKIE